MKTYNVVPTPRNGKTTIGFNGVNALTITHPVALTFTVRKGSRKPANDAPGVSVDLDGTPLFTVAPGDSLSIRITAKVAGVSYAYTVTREALEATEKELIARGILSVINETREG